MKVTVKRDGKIDSIVSMLKTEGGQHVRVGVLEGAQTVDGKPMAEIATYLEYGWVQRITKAQAGYFRHTYGIGLHPGGTLNLPPRPFFRGTFAAEYKKWAQLGGKAVFHYNSLTKALQLVGMTAQGDIQATIRNGGTSTEKFPRRSPMTMEILRKNAEGHEARGKNVSGGGASATDQPLILSGRLLNSISFEIVKDGDA